VRFLPFFLLLAALAGTPPPEKTPELVALKEKLGRTASLQAKFVQKRHWAALKDPLVTEGTFVYERPDKLRWHASPPNESELVLDGKKAVMRYPALGTQEQFDLTSDPGMATILDSILAVLQADVDRLAPLYELTVTRRSPLEIELKPRSAQVAAVVERIDLSFDARLYLTNVMLREAGGDWTEIAFRDQIAK
jgi:outer membrane lipoprotein-sorting protein